MPDEPPGRPPRCWHPAAGACSRCSAGRRRLAKSRRWSSGTRRWRWGWWRPAGRGRSCRTCWEAFGLKVSAKRLMCELERGCGGKRERERDGFFVCFYVWCVWERECVCVWERERERERGSLSLRTEIQSSSRLQCWLVLKDSRISSERSYYSESDRGVEPCAGRQYCRKGKPQLTFHTTSTFEAQSPTKRPQDRISWSSWVTLEMDCGRSSSSTCSCPSVVIEEGSVGLINQV